MGIGGEKVANKAVTLPISLQWAQKPVDMQLYSYVGDTPEGVAILMGLDIQEPLGTVIDRPASVIRFQSKQMEVKTESTLKVTSRMKTPPITVVPTNAGCNFAYAAVRNAGFAVSKWYSVEADEVCRSITDTIVPPHGLVRIDNRTDQVGNQIDKVKVDLKLAGHAVTTDPRCYAIGVAFFSADPGEARLAFGLGLHATAELLAIG